MNRNEQPIVTVVVVPRESFNMFPEVIERIYEVTSPMFKLMVMEGHAPETVRKQLRQIEKTKSNCKVVWSDRWLYPHEAVNQAIPMIDTEFVVFIDNDVEVEKGWLEALVVCAEEENVGCVHPIYLTTKLSNPAKKIHVAEGKLIRKRYDGQWFIDTTMTFSGMSLKDYPDPRRKPSEFFEWHCVMFRKSLLDKVGLLDDLNIAEHLDYVLRMEQAGERILLEPKAVVAYDYERIWQLRGDDRRYLLYRWGVEKAEKSLERLREKWNLVPTATSSRLRWVKMHTGKVRSTFLLPRILNRLRRSVGMRPISVVQKEKVEAVAE